MSALGNKAPEKDCIIPFAIINRPQVN